MPLLFWNWLIPRKAKLMMLQSEIDFPLLQTLLISRRSKIVDIRIRNIIGFAKECRLVRIMLILVNNFLTQFEQLFVGISQISCVQDVVIISSTIETNKFQRKQIFDLFRSRVNHSIASLVFSFVFPIDQKQIRKDFDVEENQRVPIAHVWARRNWIFGFKMHLIDQFHTIQGMISAICRKRQNLISKIGYVVMHSRRICIVQNLFDEVDAGLCSSVILFFEVALNQSSQSLLAFYSVEVNHRLSFRR